MIVDDVLTSGSSIKETRSVLEGLKIEVSSAIVAIKRGNPELPIPYSLIFTIEEITEK